MALIYIDTNVYLDFYQSSEDRVSIFEEIEAVAHRIVMPDQTAWEFMRNRAARLETLAQELRRSISGSVHTSSILRDMPEHATIVQHQKEIKKCADGALKTIESWLEHAGSDPVFLAFQRILGKAKRLEQTERAYALAQKRKALGNPPTSPDKHTIGDEIIWETLLAGCEEDLILVTRDKTFHTNRVMLRVEFSKNDKRDLKLVTKSLSAALAMVGLPSLKVENAEKEVDKNREEEARSSVGNCEHCGGNMQMIGYEGTDGDSAHWYYCTNCKKEYFPK